jgi:hypothetical protein
LKIKTKQTLWVSEGFGNEMNSYTPLNVPVRLLGPGSKQEIALVNMVPRSLTGTLIYNENKLHQETLGLYFACYNSKWKDVGWF